MNAAPTPTDLDEGPVRFGPKAVPPSRNLRFWSSPFVVFTLMSVLLALFDAAGRWDLYLGRYSSTSNRFVSGERVYGNLSHVGAAIAVAGLWSLIVRGRPSVNVVIAFIAGAAGGLVRLYVVGETWAELTTRERSVVVVSSGLFMVVSAVLAGVISRTAISVSRERNSLIEALRGEQTSRELILSAETQLRREISERLHGPLQAELITAVHQLRKMGGEGDALADRLDHVREHEVRRLSHALHPSLVDIDLGTALEQLRDFHAQHGHIDLDLSGLSSDPFNPSRITGRLALAIHRIVEEAINNSFRHGGATHVDVKVWATPSQVDVTVTDNGSGPPPDAVPGVGMRMIHTWVRSFGGTWDLIADARKGAVVHATFPLRDDHAERNEASSLFAND